MGKGGARMNVVILKHTDCGRQFVFEVSENVVEAMRDAFGCKLPLSSIVGKHTLEMWGNSDYEP